MSAGDAGGPSARAESPAKAPGLSPRHNSPPTRPEAVPWLLGDVPAHVEMAPDGGRLRVTRGRKVPRAPKGRNLRRRAGTRGTVTKFSHKSRRRLMLMLRQLDQRAVPLFVTLTYPAGEGDSVPDSAAVQRDLDVFGKRLRRRYPSASAVWKREYTRRGVPHLHLLVFGLYDGSHWSVLEARTFVAAAWADACDTGNAKHLDAGTSVETPRKSGAVAKYVGKYVWKAGTVEAESSGRWWGYVNRSGLPWAELRSVLVPEWVAVRMMRAGRRYAGLRCFAASPTVNVLVGNPARWAALLAYWLGEYDARFGADPPVLVGEKGRASHGLRTPEKVA